MKSEKVKEIKKALECMSGLCICFNCEVDRTFDEESTCKEALTLINELEETNKKLKQSNKNILFVNEQVIKRNEELESENERLRKMLNR